MDGWLPPRAPGGKPPPRFDAAPPAPAAAPEQGRSTPAEPEQRPRAPAGWQPPTPPSPPSSPPTGGSRAAGDAGAEPGWVGPSGGPAEPSRLGAGRPAERPPLTPAAAGAANPAAVWALVFGITGLLLLVLSLGFAFLLALPCSGAAWLLARRAAARIASGESGRGAGQAQAALWLGRIGTVASVAAMTAFIALSAFGYDFEALRDTLQEELERRRDAAR
jgi:hypothetical protein